MGYKICDPNIDHIHTAIMAERTVASPRTPTSSQRQPQNVGSAVQQGDDGQEVPVLSIEIPNLPLQKTAAIMFILPVDQMASMLAVTKEQYEDGKTTIVAVIPKEAGIACHTLVEGLPWFADIQACAEAPPLFWSTFAVAEHERHLFTSMQQLRQKKDDATYESKITNIDLLCSHLFYVSDKLVKRLLVSKLERVRALEELAKTETPDFKIKKQTKNTVLDKLSALYGESYAQRIMKSALTIAGNSVVESILTDVGDRTWQAERDITMFFSSIAEEEEETVTADPKPGAQKRPRIVSTTPIRENASRSKQRNPSDPPTVLSGRLLLFALWVEIQKYYARFEDKGFMELIFNEKNTWFDPTFMQYFKALVKLRHTLQATVHVYVGDTLYVTPIKCPSVEFFSMWKELDRPGLHSFNQDMTEYIRNDNPSQQKQRYKKVLQSM